MLGIVLKEKNIVDIINVISVAAKANVHHLGELDDYKSEGVYWRQAFDYVTLQLSEDLAQIHR